MKTRSLRLLASTLLNVLALLASAGSLSAHNGEDHGDTSQSILHYSDSVVLVVGVVALVAVTAWGARRGLTGERQHSRDDV
jgi:hypothetical protein